MFSFTGVILSVKVRSDPSPVKLSIFKFDPVTTPVIPYAIILRVFAGAAVNLSVVVAGKEYAAGFW